MGVQRIHVRGLKQFRRELRAVDKAFPKELRKALAKVSKLMGKRARAAADRRAKRAIRSRATQRAAYIRVTPGPRGDSLGVVLGQKRRSGWYAARRYAGSRGRQFRPWVGSSWDPGETGSMPYEIGPAINSSVDEAVEVLGDAIDDLAGRAFH